MISGILKAFQKSGKGEPLWYIRLRAFIAFCCLAGIIAYFVILLIGLSKREKYIVVGRVSMGDQGYNGTIPFPDSLQVSTELFSSQNANITCYTWTLAHPNQEYPGCIGLLYAADAINNVIIYKPVLENLMWFSDLEQCTTKKNCPTLYSFQIAFTFPPVDINTTFASPDIQVMVSNTFVWPANIDLSDPLMETTYNLEYGDIYDISFEWTEYTPIGRNPYYINTQQSTKLSIGSNYTSAGMTFTYTTSTIGTNTERYVTSIGDILGLVGGLYSGIATIFSLLFGVGMLFPWGILPKYLFRPLIVRQLREEYSVVNAAKEKSCPLGDPLPISSTSSNEGVVNLEDFAYLQARVAKLESLLARFYLDADLLRSPPNEISTEKSPYDIKE